jgi:hypothetical protein
MFDTQDALLAFAEADSDHLLALVGVSPDDGPAPADVLDTVIEDGVMYGLLTDELGHRLGLCDYERRWIVVNSRLAAITLPNTNLAALALSTKAHELAHVRLPHHRPQLEALDPQARFCPTGAQQTEAARHRELEADVYAGVFLVPSRQVGRTAGAASLRRHIEQGDALSSETLWRMVIAMAADFRVTGALMAHRLHHLGLVVKAGRVLSLPPGVPQAA